VILYLDTSSLVKLYIQEGGSEEIAALVADATIVATSGIAYPEARAAFARRRRERAITRSAHASIVRRFDADWSSYLSLELTDAIAREAGALADRFGLRGGDAVHLAAFADLLGRTEDEEAIFSTADARLARAARRLG